VLRGLIDFALNYRWVVLSVTAGIAALGVYIMLNIPIEAFPDLTTCRWW
jgi:Cu/Ag efflux pump CusA